MGLASNQKLEHYPRKYLGVNYFLKNLKSSAAFAATDLGKGEEPVYSRVTAGPGCGIVRISRDVCPSGSRWPGAVDGFLAAPVPVDALRKMGADVVIAVLSRGGHKTGSRRASLM